MSETDILGQSKRLRPTSYSPDSPTDLADLMDEREHSMSIDQSNVIMKTPQSLDVDEDEDEDEDENEDSNDLTSDQPTKKKGKISLLSSRCVCRSSSEVSSSFFFFFFACCCC